MRLYVTFIQDAPNGRLLHTFKFRKLLSETIRTHILRKSRDCPLLRHRGTWDILRLGTSQRDEPRFYLPNLVNYDRMERLFMKYKNYRKV